MLLIAPSYVKPFVKRQKNDAADAEAICEAAMRPTMRFVAVKSEAKQASAVVFKARDLLVRQRTQIINALRGHMAEFGVIVPQGPSHVEYLLERIENPASDLPEAARGSCLALAATLHSLAEQIEDLDREVTRRARQDEAAKRLITIPGAGPVIATALDCDGAAVETFTRGPAVSSASWLRRGHHALPCSRSLRAERSNALAALMLPAA